VRPSREIYRKFTAWSPNLGSNRNSLYIFSTVRIFRGEPVSTSPENALVGPFLGMDFEDAAGAIMVADGDDAKHPPIEAQAMTR